MRRAGSDLNPNDFLHSSRFTHDEQYRGHVADLPIRRRAAVDVPSGMSTSKKVVERQARGTGSYGLLLEVSCAHRGVKVLMREPRRGLNCATDSGQHGYLQWTTTMVLLRRDMEGNVGLLGQGLSSGS